MEISETGIEALRMSILRLSEGEKAETILQFVKKKGTSLSSDFIWAFKPYCKPDTISISYRPSLKLMRIFPEHFQFDAWLANKEKDPNVIFETGFFEKFCNDPESKDERYALALQVIECSPISEFTDAFARKALAAAELIGGRALGRIIAKTSFREEITPEFASEVIKFLAEAYRNDKTIQIFENRALEAAWTKEDIESLIKGAAEITLETFIKAILSRNDIGWQNRLIREALAGEFTIVSANVGSSEWFMFVLKSLDENIVPDFLELCRKCAPGLLDHDVLKWLLEYLTDIPEEFITEKGFIYEFSSQGLRKKLADYCSERGYETALIMLATI